VALDFSDSPSLLLFKQAESATFATLPLFLFRFAAAISNPRTTFSVVITLHVCAGEDRDRLDQSNRTELESFRPVETTLARLDRNVHKLVQFGSNDKCSVPNF
jgi:hypothetical protein